MPEDQKESEMDEGQESEGQELEEGGQEEFDQERAMGTIYKLRAVEKTQKQELKAAQARLAELEQWKKGREQEEMSELEKAQARVQELEQAQADAESETQAREMEINERLIRAEVRVVAAGLGFTSPEDAYHLADLVDVTVEDDGSVKGVEKALKVLVKAKPYLLGENGRGSVGTPPRGGKRTGKAADPVPVRVKF